MNQNDNSQILLRDISDVHMFSLIQSFCAYGLDHISRILSVTTAATASRSMAIESAPSATPCVLDDTAFVFLQDGRHRLQTPQDFQKATGVACIEDPSLVWCVAIVRSFR